MKLAVLRLPILVASFSATAAWAAPPGWLTYVNARFGTTLEYPPAFSQSDPEPDNGDGRTLRTTDGRATLTVHGGLNVLRQTPEQALATLRTDKKRTYTYTTANNRFYVASGTDGGSVFYERCNYARALDGVRDCLSLTYPASDVAQWNAGVTGMSASLRNNGVGVR